MTCQGARRAATPLGGLAGCRGRWFGPCALLRGLGGARGGLCNLYKQQDGRRPLPGPWISPGGGVSGRARVASGERTPARGRARRLPTRQAGALQRPAGRAACAEARVKRSTVESHRRRAGQAPPPAAGSSVSMKHQSAPACVAPPLCCQQHAGSHSICRGCGIRLSGVWIPWRPARHAQHPPPLQSARRPRGTAGMDGKGPRQQPLQASSAGWRPRPSSARRTQWQAVHLSWSAAIVVNQASPRSCHTPCCPPSRRRRCLMLLCCPVSSPATALYSARRGISPKQPPREPVSAPALCTKHRAYERRAQAWEQEAH